MLLNNIVYKIHILELSSEKEIVLYGKINCVCSCVRVWKCTIKLFYTSLCFQKNNFEYSSKNTHILNMHL